MNLKLEKKEMISRLNKGFLGVFFAVAALVIVVDRAESARIRPEIKPEQLFKAEVIKVIDGDTIRLKDGRLVRYLGIDAPELRRKVDNAWVYDPEPFASEAAKLNQKLVQGKEVLIEVDPARTKDKYGRLLAYVYVDKILVNEELIRVGLAKTDIRNLYMKHRIRFWSIEEMAWSEKLGIWAVEGASP